MSTRRKLSPVVWAMSPMCLGAPCGPSPPPPSSIALWGGGFTHSCWCWWVKLKTNNAVSTVLHSAPSNVLLLGPYCIPLLFHLSCVLICLDLPAFLMLPSKFSFFLSLPCPFPHFKIFVNVLNWKCRHIVQNIKVTKGYRGGCALPLISQFPLPEEPIISFLPLLPEVCYTYPNKYGYMFSYSPQMATHYTQCF